MHRIKLLVIPGILAIVLFLTVDLFDQPRIVTEPTELSAGPDYEGYSEGINTVQFDERGRIKYTVSASRQISYTNNETSLDEPFLQLYRENDSRWNIIARSGRISSGPESSTDIAEIVLAGGVEVYRLDERGNRTVLSTDSLSIDPDSEILTSADHVTLQSDSLEQTATGMQVNLGTEEYIFYRDVRGRYAAPIN
jgi:LPS export ABC transporter protein LptC